MTPMTSNAAWLKTAAVQIASAAGLAIAVAMAGTFSQVKSQISEQEMLC